MQEAVARKLMDDLEEVVGGNLEDAHQRILDRLRHVAEAALVVSTFEDMNLCEWHLQLSWLDVTEACWLEWLPPSLLRRVLAPHRIGAVDANRLELDADFVRASGGYLRFDELENIQSTGLCEL